MADETILTGAGESTEAGENTSAGESTEAGENTGAGESTAGENTGAGENTASAVASYGDFTFPEGFTSNADQVKSFSEVALKHGLTQEQAQELLNVQSLGTQNTANAQQTAWDKIQDDWHAETKADADLGGKNFEKTAEAANKGLDAISTPKLHELLKSVGINHNIEVVRAFVRVNELVDRLKAATGDDTLEFGNTSVEAKDKTAAEVLYPDLS